MDKKEEALSKFRNPYSCAQTIWAAFGDTDEGHLANMKENSGGRAPDNMCGALYAALRILTQDRQAEAVAIFTQKAGSTKCLEIKTKFKTPCPRCVEIAAEILSKSE